MTDSEILEAMLTDHGSTLVRFELVARVTCTMCLAHTEKRVHLRTPLSEDARQQVRHMATTVHRGYTKSGYEVLCEDCWKKRGGT